jgi:SAM-dependent methyltransferase
VTDEHKPEVHAQFGGSAEAYVGNPGHAQGEDLDRLLLWGRARGAARVLDIATGGGDTALAFSRFTPTVVATALTLSVLGAARNFIAGQGVAGVYFSAADVEALPFRDENFGVVTCRIAPPLPELLPALRQVARCCGAAVPSSSRTSGPDAEMATFILG